MKSLHFRAPCLAGLLLLGGFTQNPDHAAEDALLRDAYVWRANVGSHSNRGLEETALPAAHGRVTRKGDDLVLALAGGRTKVLHRDSGACLDDDADCGVFRLAAALPSRHFYLVDKMDSAGGANFLIDDRSGDVTQIGAIPVFSPDGSRFLVQNNDGTGNAIGHNLEIWRRVGDRAVLEWSANPTEEDTGVDNPTGPYGTDLVRWRGNRITLTFSLGTWMGQSEANIGDHRRWTGTIVHGRNGWRLRARALTRPSVAAHHKLVAFGILHDHVAAPGLFLRRAFELNAAF